MILVLFLQLGCVTLERGTFECGGKASTTISTSRVCDGVIDCWGGQDERQDDCATALSYCDQPEPEAILQSAVCDGTEDCPSGIDEQDCPAR